MNNELGLITVGLLLLLVALTCTLAGVRLHHWLLEHPPEDDEPVEPGEPDPSMAIDDPTTMPLEIVTVPTAGSAADVPESDTGRPHLTLTPAAVTFEPVPARTIERSEMTTQVLRVQIAELHERLEHTDGLRARYLRSLRVERRREAEAVLAVPEIAQILATPPVLTIIRHIQDEEATG